MDQIISFYYDQKQFMGSVLVSRGDQVLFDKSYGYANLEWNTPFTQDSKFRLGSVTKQFTAASIMLLQERGKLRTSDLISTYLADTPEAWNKITIRNLLTNTSGIPNFTAVPDYATTVAIMPTTPDKQYLSFRDKPLDFQPDEKYSYSNSNYTLLGMIVEKTSDIKYSDFLKQNIFKPLQMNNSGMDSNNRILHHRVYGYRIWKTKIINAAYANMTFPFSAGGMYSTTHDLAIWNTALYEGNLLKLESLNEMTTPYKDNYCYGLYFNPLGDDKNLGHDGKIDGFRAYLSYFLTDRLSVIVLGNVENGVSGIIAANLASVVHGKHVPLPHENEVSQTPDVLG